MFLFALLSLFSVFDSAAAFVGTRIVFEFTPAKGHGPTYEWLKESEWCWGIEVPYYFAGEELGELYNHFEKVAVSYDANPGARKREAEYKKRPVYSANEVFSPHREAGCGGLSDTLWLGLLENDSAGTRFPQIFLREKPQSHADAKKLIDEHVIEALKFSGDYNMPFWGVCGYAQSAHIFAEHGVDCVLVERANDDVEDLQTAVAFARGASRQFGCKWGIDISLWWGPIYGCVQDMDTSFHRRHLYISYFSGADAFRIEGGHLFYNLNEQSFSRFKGTMDKFGEFVMNVSPGEPVVPVAVMLSEDHGWMSAPYWQTTRTAWNYARIPYRQGQRGIDGFFGLAFPGNVYAMQAFPFGSYEDDDPPASPFALSCITEYFAPSKSDIYNAEPPLPFGLFDGRDEARKALYEGRRLQADYRPMSDSRWGDIFDVLTVKADSQVLSEYELVILCGQIELTESLKKRLVSYAQGGGKIIISAGAAAPDDKELTGITFSPELLVGKAVKWKGRPFENDTYLYVPLNEKDESVSVLARTDTGRPAVTFYRLGKGEVYTVLTPWYEAGHSDISLAGRMVFDEVISSSSPVEVEGLPVEWLTTKGKDSRTVLVANHQNSKWTGTVNLKKDDFKAQKCTELLSGDNVLFGSDRDGYKVSLEVGPYDMKIIRWGK